MKLVLGAAVCALVGGLLLACSSTSNEEDASAQEEVTGESQEALCSDMAGCTSDKQCGAGRRCVKGKQCRPSHCGGTFPYCFCTRDCGGGTCQPDPGAGASSTSSSGSTSSSSSSSGGGSNTCDSLEGCHIDSDCGGGKRCAHYPEPGATCHSSNCGGTYPNCVCTMDCGGGTCVSL